VHPIVWDERLATGDPHIDAQHEELHDLVLELGMLAEEEPDRVALGDVLFDVLAYASTHFEDEEALMERIGFPGLARQKVLHQEFRTEVEDMAKRFADGDATLTASQMQERLHGWLLHHVWEEDLQLAAYLAPYGN
jgi:hemerythrin